MIFPEGRIANGKKLIQFKHGAFLPGHPVVPILLRYPSRHFSVPWTGDNRGAMWYLRMMTQFVNHCELEVLDVHASAESDPEGFAQEVRQVMADKLEVGTTEHSYDDALLYRTALEKRVKPDFEVKALRSLLDLDVKDLKAFLTRFHRYDANGDGLIDRAEFDAVLQDLNPLQSHRRRDRTAGDRIFGFFDTDGSGRIEYREFVQCLALFSGKCSDKDRALIAFLMLDHDGVGWIWNERLRDILGDLSSRLPAVAPSTPGADARTDARKASLQKSATVALEKQLLSSAGAGALKKLDFEEFYKIVESKPDVLRFILKRAWKPFARGHPTRPGDIEDRPGDSYGSDGFACADVRLPITFNGALS
jgi:lysophosphatidylcholine acyltransferase/lyso-PAF acetyltransferase